MPSGSLAQAFPPELFEAIIDFLYNDIPSLCACGLVYWQWNTFSRSLIYVDGSTIHLIRTFNIKNAWDNNQANRIFESLLPRPGLWTLFLEVGASWWFLTSRAKRNIAQMFQYVTKLSLSSVTFDSLDHAFDILNNASQATDLAFSVVHCARYEIIGDAQIVLHAYLRLRLPRTHF
ncbi:hypothetical protein M422DRAFT_256097 [Sphaerobolus stellatus SS14]|uniref:F-box domain-containing protein n=1 Tax=Sphaerobolus stellatus (strain SS14) TaxID=990650 RepID=A0A0C9VSC7_SPHS4|nr:hypothetical protein M422DRAFT_256097 [Sphaerobolus stellatus SS14]